MTPALSTQRNQNACFLSLPPELYPEILKHLPLTPTLSTLASVHRVFALHIYNSHSFAKLHIQYAIKTSNAPTIWDYLHTQNLIESGWHALPLPYKVHLYAELLTQQRWPRSDEGMPLSENLFYCLRWKSGPETALRIIQEIHSRYPHFPWTAHKNRAFRWACRAGNLAVLEYMLAELDGINPGDEDCLGLHWAVENRHEEVVLLLLRVGVDPAYNDNFCIKIAAQEGMLDVVRVLCGQGFEGVVDVAAQDNFAVRLAAQNGHIEVVQTLLATGKADPSASNNYGIILAARNGFANMVELLLTDCRVDPRANNQEAIVDASSEGHVGVVDILLRDTRVDPSVRGGECIKKASENGHVSVVQRLLRDKRVDPTIEKQYPLREAALAGHSEVVAVLLEDHRVNLDDSWSSVIPEVVERKHWNVLNMLMSKLPQVGHVDLKALLCNDAMVDVRFLGV
ncbi:hypothetical protein HDU99_003656 [Rhizoclosmatium hyalinum]|nr:hypothetical protein HDU99_003656 [Rhizoclosmatium hyalinum]